MEGAKQTLHDAGWLRMLYDFIFALTLQEIVAHITECSVAGLTSNPPSERTWYSFPHSSLSYNKFHCNLPIQTRNVSQMANLAFPGTHLVAVLYLDMACPESQYIHCYVERLPGSALPRKGRGPPGAAAWPCHGSIVTFVSHCCSSLSHHGLGAEVWVHLPWSCSTKVPAMGESGFLKVLWACCPWQCYCLHQACCYPSNLVFHILYTMKLAIIRAQFVILFLMVVLLIKRLSQCSSASPLNPCQDGACVNHVILWKMAINCSASF